MLRTLKHSFLALPAHFRRGCQSVPTIYAVLLLSLFTFSALAAESQPDAPTNEQPTAQKDQRADDNQKQPEPANAEPAAAPSIVDFFTPKGLHKISNYCANKPDSEPDKWLHEKFICDVHITDIAIAVFTGLLVLVTIPLAIIGWRQSRIASQTAKRQLRAYVWQEANAAPSQLGDGYRTDFEIRNTGITPAYNVRCWARMEALDHLAIEEYEFEQAPKEIKKPRFVVNPGSFHAQREGVRMTTAEKYAVAEDVKRFYLWGEIRYEDAFGKGHTTKFRLVWRESFGSGIWAYCDEGNKAD